MALLNIVCRECGNPLQIELDDEESTIYVAICLSCKEGVKHIAFNEGWSQGVESYIKEEEANENTSDASDKQPT